MLTLRGGSSGGCGAAGARVGAGVGAFEGWRAALESAGDGVA